MSARLLALLLAVIVALAGCGPKNATSSRAAHHWTQIPGGIEAPICQGTAQLYVTAPNGSLAPAPEQDGAGDTLRILAYDDQWALVDALWPAYVARKHLGPAPDFRCRS